jgi:hypothetical protein
MSSLSNDDFSNDKMTIFYDSNENLTALIQNTTSINENDIIFVIDNDTMSDYLNNTNDVQSNYQTSNENSSQNIQAYLNFRFILTWISLAVIIIGLVGNSISFVILINPKMRISTNVFLSSLCVSGFIALFGFLINSVTYELVAYYENHTLLHVLYFFYPYIYPLITTFQMASILLTVCVSVNQFLCIYFSRVKSNQRRAKDDECKNALRVVLIMYLISIVYNIPYWLKFKYSDGMLTYTEIGKNNMFNKIVHFWLYLPIVYIIPFSILIITNSYLLYRIIKARRKRIKLGLDKNLNKTAKSPLLKCANKKKKIENNEIIHTGSSNMTNSNQNINNGNHATTKSNIIKDKLENVKESEVTNVSKRIELSSNNKNQNVKKQIKTGGKNITIMLIAVVFFFFICQFPNLIVHIFQSMICSSIPSICADSNVYKYSIVTCKFLLICNLSFNFAFYCLFSEKFREVFKETFKIR